MFRTMYEPHERVVANLGSRIHKLYSPEFSKDGSMDLVESGQEDLYAFIQSHAASVDINVLLQQYKNGDPTALSRAQGAFGDFTQMPGTYAEMLNSVIKGEEYFMSLPVEVRAKFDHSFQKWLITAGQDQWYTDMGIQIPGAPVDVPAPTPNPPLEVAEPAPATP